MQPNTRKAAPLNREALDLVVAPFGESKTLPGEAYTSQDLFGWELENFFEAGWVCAGRSEDLVRAGDQRAVRCGRQSVVLVRENSGALRGFFNVCRHRGHELLDVGACAHARVIRCPYHGWVYGLDGALKVAPRFGDLQGFDCAEHSLVPVRVELWHNWVFVNASRDAPPLAEYVGRLDQFVSAHEPERLIVAAQKSYEAAANWKLLVENYHECYHCPQIHPQLCRVSPPDSGRNMTLTEAWTGGSMELMAHAETMSMTGKSHGAPLPGLDEEQKRLIYYYGLFPNLLISLHPDYILTHRLEPLATNRTLIECNWLFPPEVVEREDFSPDYAVEFWDVTNRQDWRACESVQRGVGSLGYRQGPLTEREGAVYSFITQVARGYLAGGISPREPAVARDE